MKTHPKQIGFTIVELLVVIVVIGILAAITAISYSGISQKAVTAAVQSDLNNASKKLKLYYTLYASYPTAMNGNNCPTAPNADVNYCITTSNGSTLTYNSVAPSTFHLTNTKNNVSYSLTDGSALTIATTANGSTVGNACPIGYIPVPGSGTYGTNDFCVMKYEAKIQDVDDGFQNYNVAFDPESRASGTPWVSATQAEAVAEAQAICTGCHLITDAEWMTVAQNVLSVSSNWSTGVVGSGYIYSGHNDGDPWDPLAADPSDANGYAGETNTGGNQRRTLALYNGEIIWDFAGNVSEWTTGTVTTGQPGILGGGYAYREWTAITSLGTQTVSPYPSSTGIAGARTWTSSVGIGRIYSNANETALRGFLRGGTWGIGGAGVLTLNLSNAPTATDPNNGFRVSR